MREEWDRFWDQREKIRAVIRDLDEKEFNLILEDICDSLIEAGNPFTHRTIAYAWAVVAKIQKKTKTKKVIKNILGKVFDISQQEWYSMDIRDLRHTCDLFGGPGFFRHKDFDLMYIVVLQKLRHGPIRDKCFELELSEFLFEKRKSIDDEHFKFLNDY
ncbi:MAG: hypothetical protein HEP71_03405 [Roseivirga sp.]|nr:hypothetical protein [Roseivirga sp.]